MARGEPVAVSRLIRGGANPNDLSLGQRIVFELPWHAAALLLRLLYGFRVEGAEFLPDKGPFILVSNEHSPIAFLITGWIAITTLKKAFLRNPETIAFLREELFDFPFFRNALNDKTPGRYAPLNPVSAGRLALGLLEAYRTLQGGGIVVLNPEGDMPWDGRPLPLGHALAWLGLHTAAPIVPAIITSGAYDIWPHWQPWMNLKGQVRLRIGKPFRLVETPRERVTDEDMAATELMMRARFDELCYGSGGLAEWTGASTRHGIPLERPPKLSGFSVASERSQFKPQPIAPWRKGIALLLWRCPVCLTDDALVHDRPLLGEPTLRCQVCRTRWRVRRIPTRDFRLQVLEGPTDLVGLDMALSAWYDAMKRDMQPARNHALDVRLNTEEEFITETSNVSLLPRQPSALLGSWNGREPPRFQLSLPPQAAGWVSVGKGRLVLTDKRLIWQGPRGELDFWWCNINSISLWMFSTLTIRYGAAPYRFELGQENGLKWLTYAGVQARRASAQTGRKLKTSAF
jgi:1-acyl-sn-glycerol-3-phosphate acyltransferase